MKLSPFENDKSTYVDEIIFSIITLVLLAIGIALVVLKPSIWIFEESLFVGFGIILILLTVIYIPCIIYRFATNDKK